MRAVLMPWNHVAFIPTGWVWPAIAFVLACQVLPARAEEPAGMRRMRCDIIFPQSATTPSRTVYIPFVQVGQLITVETLADSVSGRFIVDTGSEHLVLNRAYFQASAADRPVAAVGNTGRVTSAAVRRVDSLRAESLTLYDREAHVADLGHIETKKNTRIVGILGYEAFAGYDLMIDMPGRYIALIPVDRAGHRLDSLAVWETPVDSLAFDLQHHLIMVTAVVNRVSVPMILDSGAELNLIDRNVKRKVLDNFTILKRVNMVGVGDREVEVLAGVMTGVRCGNQVTGRMNTLLTSLDEINAGFGTRAQGVLGYEFLRGRRVWISYAREKLYFFPPHRS